MASVLLLKTQAFIKQKRNGPEGDSETTHKSAVPFEYCAFFGSLSSLFPLLGLSSQCLALGKHSVEHLCSD